MTDEDWKLFLEGALGDVRRHFDTSTEALRGEIRAIAEGVENSAVKLEREVASVRHEMRGGFAETQAMIKFSHAELDRRVAKLEEAFADLQARVERLESTTH